MKETILLSPTIHFQTIYQIYILLLPCFTQLLINYTKYILFLSPDNSQLWFSLSYNRPNFKSDLIESLLLMKSPRKEKASQFVVLFSEQNEVFPNSHRATVKTD